MNVIILNGLGDCISALSSRSQRVWVMHFASQQERYTFHRMIGKNGDLVIEVKSKGCAYKKRGAISCQIYPSIA